MVLLGVLVLLVGEVATLAAVGSAIGVLPTLGLLLAGMVIGGWLVRHEGTRAWRALSAAAAEGKPPGPAVVDGVLVLIGGALIVFPGFVSDVLGLLCLLPPTRAGLRFLVIRWALRRANRGTVVRVRSQRGPGAAEPAAGPGEPGRGRVIEGEIAPPDQPGPDAARE